MNCGDIHSERIDPDEVYQKFFQSIDLFQ